MVAALTFRGCISAYGSIELTFGDATEWRTLTLNILEVVWEQRVGAGRWLRIWHVWHLGVGLNRRTAPPPGV